MKCQDCDAEIKSEWFKDSYLVHCHECGCVFNTKKPNSTTIKVFEPLSSFNFSELNNVSETTIPNYSVGDLVTCIDSKNENFLEFGEVIKLDHMHVRIKFEKMNIWMPDNIVTKVPEEWI